MVWTKNLPLSLRASVFFAKTLHLPPHYLFDSPRNKINILRLFGRIKKMSEIMKTENVNNELVLGNKDNSSSHYRIKSETEQCKVKIQVMAKMESVHPNEQTEYLMCSIGFKSEFIAVCNNGSGEVQIFALKDYIDTSFKNKKAPFIKLSLKDYINPDTFGKIVEKHFLTLKKQAV